MMKSKIDCYNLFKFGLKAYLPSYRSCTMEYLRQLLYGSKLIVYKDKFTKVDVPKWSEFNVMNVYKQVHEKKQFI